MNINLIRIKSVVTELRGIRQELTRLADCWEAELAEKGFHMRPPRADTSGPEPTVTYVDEEVDFVRETIDRMKRDDSRAEKEDV